jgi:hypothetical protein
MAQDYYGSDNVQRFLGKWNLFLDGYPHSIEVIWNDGCDWSSGHPLRIMLFNQLNCQGPVEVVLNGEVSKNKSMENSHKIIMFRMDTHHTVYLIEGFLFTQTGRHMAGKYIKRPLSEYDIHDTNADGGWNAAKIQ